MFHIWIWRSLKHVSTPVSFSHSCDAFAQLLMALVAYGKHSRKNQSCFICALSVDPKLNMLEKTYLSISRCCLCLFLLFCFKKQDKYAIVPSGKDMGLETFGPNLHRYRCIRATYLLTWLICGLQIAWEKWLTGSSSCSWCPSRMSLG